MTAYLYPFPSPPGVCGLLPILEETASPHVMQPSSSKWLKGPLLLIWCSLLPLNGFDIWVIFLPYLHTFSYI